MANNLAEFKAPRLNLRASLFNKFILEEHARNTLKHAISYIFNTNAPSALDAFDILEEKRLSL
jgi:hypothetical protein